MWHSPRSDFAIVGILRREGVQGVVRGVGQRIRSSKQFLLCTCPLTTRVCANRSFLSPEIRRFTAPTREFCSIYRAFTDDTAYIRRFTESVFCDVAFVQDAPAAFQWISLGDSESPSLNTLLLFGPGDAYLAELYVRPLYRGEGLAPLMHHRVYQELSVKGFRRMVALIAVGNRPMLRLAEKIGYRPCAIVSMRRRAPFERLCATPSHPADASGIVIKKVRRGVLPFWRSRWILTLAQSLPRSPEDAGAEQWATERKFHET